MNMRNTILNSALILLSVWSVLLEHNLVTAQKLSRKMRRQHENLNKIAVLTIQTSYGDTYDCVDFYQQPAFDHPLLKNHTYTYQMNYSLTELEERKTKISSSYRRKPSDIWSNGKGCPIGTVPIKRTSRYDILKVNSAADIVPQSILNAGVHVALLRSTGDQKYYGGGMYTSVYKPIVQDKQYSSSRIKFQNGPDSIAAGWVVHPHKFGDNEARFFIYTLTKELHCYNVECPGFVITSHDIPLGNNFEPVSQRGGETFVEKFFIRKHPITGDWLLSVGSDGKVLGFWPKAIFTGLTDFANYAEWGGEVYSPYGVDPPPMGSGCRPVGNTELDAFCKQVTVIDEDGKVDYDPWGLEAYGDNTDLYSAINQENVGGDEQYLVEFGGNHCLSECSANQNDVELTACAKK